MQDRVSGGLSPKQEEELKFWLDLRGRYLSDYAYIRMRMGEYERDTRNFPGFPAQMGTGCDLGSGLVSVLEGGPVWHKGHWYAIDPLMREFYDIIPSLKTRPYYKGDGETLTRAMGRGNLSWVFCVNTIDHTPNPANMVTEIHAALRKGGKLYFGVNFDEELYEKVHYTRFDEKLVAELFHDGWRVHNEHIEYPEEHEYPYVPAEALKTRRRYWAELEKIDG